MRFIGKLRDLRDKYARSHSRKSFPTFRAASRVTICRSCCPEKGFNVARALVGSEGTCVTILEATLKLIPEPESAQLFLSLVIRMFTRAGDHAPEIMKHKPIGLEGIDHKLIGYMKKTGLHPDDIQLLPAGKGWLLVEFGGDSQGRSGRAGARLDGGSEKRTRPRPT